MRVAPMTAAHPDSVIDLSGASASPLGESRWTSLAYFGIYRLLVASVFLAALLIYRGSLVFGSQNPQMFALVAAAYWVFALVNFLTRASRSGSFDLRLTSQVVVDILALTLLMYASGGHRSGLAFMMLIVLAAAGLIGNGRLVVFYAAVAAVAVLGEQAFRIVNARGEAADLVPVAITSAGFFAVAVISLLVGRRALNNEELARRRGVDLNNQLHINERVIRDMQDGVLVVDATGHLRQWNPSAQTLLGVVAEAGMPVAELVPGLDLTARASAVEAETTASLRSVDGTRELSARVVPVSARGDKLVYLEDLGRLQQQARELKLAALGRLTANIAHEIRNPLSSINHAAELLREEKRAETQVRLTRIINDNALRIERLIRDVLELGRRDRVLTEDIRLAQFIEDFLDELSLHQPGCLERIGVECPDDLVIRCDRIHLGQILGNLVGNALRYATDAPGAVSIRALRGASQTLSAGRVELHIIDDGSGIPDSLRGKLFEPFVTTYNKGTGLGLYIARELAAANEGKLELLDNEPGAHFRLMFTPAHE